ncbi:hypothetical protein [Paraburkholderia caledonica]|uniref:hypothetical protein n=1 Tax=Paraburkholderia caledonica TaxID=134536 RepID=UPI0011801F97
MKKHNCAVSNDLLPLVGNFFLAFAAWSISSAKAAGRMRWRTCGNRILPRDFVFRYLPHRLRFSAKKYRDFLWMSIH